MAIEHPRTYWDRLPDGRVIWHLFSSAEMAADTTWSYRCGHAHDAYDCLCGEAVIYLPEIGMDRGDRWTPGLLRAWRAHINTLLCWACLNRAIDGVTEAAESSLLMPSHPERGG